MAPSPMSGTVPAASAPQGEAHRAALAVLASLFFMWGLTEEGSGLLIITIAGGALVVMQGWLADRYSLQLSFLLTAVCELYMLFYALWGVKPPGEQLEIALTG